MTDSLLSKQRNKISEKFLKESCPHCQSILREALIVEQAQTLAQTHCSKRGEWLEGYFVCSKLQVQSPRLIFLFG